VAQDGTYELQGDLRARQARQAESRRAERLAWDGTWVLFIIDRDARTPVERAAFREAARRLRLIEWRQGLWCRPDNLDPDRLTDSRSVVAAQSTAVRGARPDDPPVERFAPEAWAAEAEHLVRAMGELEPALAAGTPDALERGFLLSADVIRHFGADPLLPDQLLGTAWPGPALRSAFGRHDLAFTSAHRQWFAAQP
jgi:phenylacetic acid degradation operon negative regulatory protein